MHGVHYAVQLCLCIWQGITAHKHCLSASHHAIEPCGYQVEEPRCRDHSGPFITRQVIWSYLINIKQYSGRDLCELQCWTYTFKGQALRTGLFLGISLNVATVKGSQVSKFINRFCLFCCGASFLIFSLLFMVSPISRTGHTLFISTRVISIRMTSMPMLVSNVLMSPTIVEQCSLELSDLLCEWAMSSFTFVIVIWLYAKFKDSERVFFFFFQALHLFISVHR